MVAATRHSIKRGKRENEYRERELRGRVAGLGLIFTLCQSPKEAGLQTEKVKISESAGAAARRINVLSLDRRPAPPPTPVSPSSFSCLLSVRFLAPTVTPVTNSATSRCVCARSFETFLLSRALSSSNMSMFWG